MIIGNVGWYLPKLHLRKHGRLDSWFHHWGDFKRLLTLAREQGNPAERSITRLMLALLVVSAATAFAGVGLFLSTLPISWSRSAA
jgi:hypothetical protein